MTKNQWGVEGSCAEDFEKWEWGSENVEGLVDRISVAAAKCVADELIKDAMFDLRTKEDDAELCAIFFEGNIELTMSLGALVADFIEGRHSGETQKIEHPDDQQEAERLAAQLERAAAAIRAAYG
jgi:hypothetical protein